MILAIGTIYQEAEGMQILLTGTYLEVHGSAQGAGLLRSSVLTDRQHQPVIPWVATN